MSDNVRSEGPKKRIWWLEEILILLCIFTLWPTILGWRHPFYEYLLYVALTTLIVIFLRRLKRFHQVRDELDR